MEIEIGQRFYHKLLIHERTGLPLMCVMLQVTHEWIRWKSLQGRSRSGKFSLQEIDRHILKLTNDTSN